MHRKLLLLVATSALCLLAVEVGVRVSGYRYAPITVEGIRTDWRAHHLFEQSYFEFDPVAIWRPVPGRSVFNARGYRGEPLPAERGPGEHVVLTIGDSNTLGWEDPRVHWPGFLEDDLRARGFAVRVANGGIWGYSSYQGRARLAELLALRPDVVTISFGANDAHHTTVPDAGYVARRARAELVLHRSGLGQLLLAALDRFDRSGDAPGGLVPRVGLEAYRENLRAMVADAEAAGARPYLLTRCWIGSARNPLVWKAFAPDYLAATRALGPELGVPVIDLHAAFAGQEVWFQDESHFTEAGHRRAAAIVAERIAADWGAPR